MKNRHCHVYVPPGIWRFGLAYTCLNIVSHWPELGRSTTVYTPISSKIARTQFPNIISSTVPEFFPDQLSGRIDRIGAIKGFLRHQTENKILKRIRPDDVLYVWPGATIAFMQKARQAGARIVTEFTNCHVRLGISLINSQQEMRGVPIDDDIESSIRYDDERINYSDYVFCANKHVESSISIDAESKNKIISTSYGATYPNEIRNRQAKQKKEMQILFVGSCIVRKGAYDLVDAWKNINFSGKLCFVGPYDKKFEDYCRSNLKPDTFTLHGFTYDVDQHYKSADIFVFPSLEEGGPQVCYEAAMYGLPMIVTDIGGGRLSEDPSCLVLVPPADSNALRDAILSLAGNPKRMAELSSRVLKHAANYEWKTIAKRRHEALAALGL